MIKSDYWRIEYEAIVSADVVFNEPVTEKEAVRRFVTYKFEDIIDSEELAIVEVRQTEPLGATDNDYIKDLEDE